MHHLASDRSWPNREAQQDQLGVSYIGKISWLFKKYSQTLKFALVTRNNFYAAGTQNIVTSGNNRPNIVAQV
jgi:hypothetical protein